MGRMTGFVFQDEYVERLAKLSDQELGRLVRALAEYHATGREPALTGRESIAFDFIKVDIDRIDDKYAARCETNKNNRQQSSTIVNQHQPTATNSNETPQDKDKDKYIKETTLKGSKEKQRFSPPSTEEVEAYCRERGNSVDARRFVDFYASKGWKVGSAPMKDWKAAVRTWEQRDSAPIKTVSAQQYQQRDYRADDLSKLADSALAEARRLKAVGE